MYVDPEASPIAVADPALAAQIKQIRLYTDKKIESIKQYTDEMINQVRRDTEKMIQDLERKSTQKSVSFKWFDQPTEFLPKTIY